MCPRMLNKEVPGLGFEPRCLIPVSTHAITIYQYRKTEILVVVLFQ